jgi:predicted phage terminase large subunit-like protein
VKKPLTRREKAIRRLIAIKDAEKDILEYTRFTMPDFRDVDDTTLSRYQVARHHRVIAEAIHMLEDGRAQKVIINCAPRHGKTELGTKRNLAWISAKHPTKSYIFGTYNNDYAGDNGRAVRDIIQSEQHAQVFPNHRLKDGSASTNRLETAEGGILSFVGRGGSITGRGGHGIVLDDPIKDRQEADSRIIRDQLWSWFTQVVMTRRMSEDSWVLIIQTRWHEDDLVGRLTDPSNPYYDASEAKQWLVIDLPALAMPNDPLGRKEGEALWPEKFPVKFLEAQRALDPRGFQALYQGRPSATQGAFFKAEHLRTYKPDQLPPNLRYYIASDHAVSARQDRDKTCLIPVGVDERDHIYVLPQVWWRGEQSNVVVEAMLNLMRQFNPLFWWAERGVISKSIGPFLRKRMDEEKTFCSIIEVTPLADKQTRAQSIQARMSMGMVHFPEHAVWWPDARDQLLKFPNASSDDFVDALAYIGMGLTSQVPAGVANRPAHEPKPLTLGWLRQNDRRDQLEEMFRRNTSGF